MPKITMISGITLRVKFMAGALHFYRDILGLKLLYGGENSSFCSFDIHGTYLNLELSATPAIQASWGRIILYCDDVDKMHQYMTSRGYEASTPKNAPWGEMRRAEHRFEARPRT